MNLASATAIFVTINGVGYTKKEYDAYKKAKKEANPKKSVKKTTRRKTKKANEIEMLAPLVKKTLNTTNIVQTLINFIDNGKKQFGHATEFIIRQHPTLKHRFAILRNRIRELDTKTKEVERFSASRESDVYQYIENLSYRLDDLRLEFERCIDAINDSNVLNIYKNERCIYETGRRLGLREIVRRSHGAMCKMVRMYEELQDIASQNGADALVYNPYTLRREDA